MFTSLSRAAWRVFFAAFVFSFFMTAGCTEVFTFSDKSYQEGMGLYRQKMYADAAGSFRTAIRQEPRHFRSHFYLGVCYEQMGQYQQAFQEYWTALEVSGYTLEGKANTDFRTQVVDTLAAAIAAHDDQEVELTRTATRARDNPNAENYFLLAKIYRLRGDADSAIDAYRRACHWDVSNFVIRKEFGLYLLDPLNQRQDAEYYLKQANRIDPNDEAVNAALARLNVTIPVQDPGATPTPAPEKSVSVPRD